ncbi:phospholipid carrier-dependent glycosyltransferase [Novosphingobium flavum]|uniref:Polyprenol-phosphate-mannose--protein mannosyltransferase n=1 Tax=Novosphingobium aerophilum TaxID=2839843 RepID=A0A7X1KDI3_9SPHN|nr:phospholipid carrier-dependent glycosyltransferase [Novosphingobium aerophilum]MBC2653361.1 phospholipid carrier-dependent glycosyltransferase [Novosphingobium aerophilum]MBC2661571.1 phospholipid carrier-dependent glycosyltransferase [Novosphingobium aerophilum]
MFKLSFPAPQRDRDPLAICAAIAIAFLVLLWQRLHLPTRIYFDEVHYVKAARELLLMARPKNPEHPLVAKEFIAAAIWLFGDTPQSWRLFPALFGSLGLFAFSRALWLASGRAFATVAGTLLLATDFLWFVMSRIAMLDMIMAGFAMLALWMLAGAVRWPGQARLRLVLAGVFLGLSLGAKWSVLATAMLPGLAFLVLRLRQHGRRFLLATDGAPIPGISLAEAGLWLGTLPLLVYFASFMPAFFYAERPVDPLHLVEYQGYMLKLQHSVVKPHPYQSVWWQWVLDIRAIWFLYEKIDGVQRGVLLLGNPFSLLAGLPALGWCLWAGWRQRRMDALAAALFYLTAIGMWVANGKPIQFFYHYLLPSTFLMAGLALALDALWHRPDRWRWAAPAALALSLALFAWFLPILSAAALCCGKPSYQAWMWLPTWR